MIKIENTRTREILSFEGEKEAGAFLSTHDAHWVSGATPKDGGMLYTDRTQTVSFNVKGHDRHILARHLRSRS